jgi:hypothetical protein
MSQLNGFIESQSLSLRLYPPKYSKSLIEQELLTIGSKNTRAGRKHGYVLLSILPMDQVIIALHVEKARPLYF